MKENNNNEEKKNADKLNLNKKQLESERSNLDKNDSEPNVRRKSDISNVISKKMLTFSTRKGFYDAKDTYYRAS